MILSAVVRHNVPQWKDGQIVGSLEADLAIEVDTDLLRHAIGNKAVMSKSGVTKLQAGAVIVRRISEVEAGK